MALKSDYTYSKRIKLSQPGYYKITFFNRQYVDFILFKSNIEINVDGNDPSGFAEIKGSPEIDIIRKTQTIMRDIESSPEMAKLSQQFSEAAQVKNESRMGELQAAYMKEVTKGRSSGCFAGEGAAHSVDQSFSKSKQLTRMFILIPTWRSHKLREEWAQLRSRQRLRQHD